MRHFPRYMIYNYHPEVPNDEGQEWWIREDGLVGLRKVTFVRESGTLRPFTHFFMPIQAFRRMQSANDGGCLLYRILVHREQQRIPVLRCGPIGRFESRAKHEREKEKRQSENAVYGGDLSYK